MTPALVLAVSRDSLFLEGLAEAFSESAALTLGGSEPPGAETFDLIDRITPDIVLVDLAPPGGSGAQLLKEIGARAPASRGVGMCDYLSDELLLACVEAGAWACLLKQLDSREFAAEVARVGAGEQPIIAAVLSRPDVTARLVRALGSTWDKGGSVGRALTRLSARELNVMSRLAEGISAEEIVAEMEMTRAGLEAIVHGTIAKLIANRSAVEIAAVCLP
jgi:DNA-binding NarL/FixJ family response regulator